MSEWPPSPPEVLWMKTNITTNQRTLVTKCTLICGGIHADFRVKPHRSQHGGRGIYIPTTDTQYKPLVFSVVYETEDISVDIES